MSRDILGVRHPFFRPLWRRIAVTVVCIGWAIFEGVMASQLWSLLFGAISVWLVIEFFLIYDPANYEDKGPKR